jgi:hypothetical protein
MDAEERERERLVVEPCQRYCRVVTVEKKDGSRCIAGVIDMTNGDVLKAETWKRPAKGARGNLYDAQGGLGRVNRYGVVR